ncbi:SCY1 protein kinase [Pyricularia oryzae 70-15]|uniref:SCY1 protein kinase n=3 Tax=Pyricularia oryzae TaxID=318829 RepID=G4MK82_PYRO7|nr:SCY1 protein kinase [Pyricularia oryzae 70-15]EHA56673.1 SCY1 protein kinase [Pyricularia oryzae 70-15]ELQ35358.1 protein kinase domain-containing protein ppk32 [Pyricularia oryzae Y34]KAI7930137.1 SCY1 protein kinase [Pyricularia oryzae]KAI7930326.1 SCY1 protein kinase [Pyricularia oryzae]
MFSNALKSISSTNITGNYSISQNSTSTAGPWKIYDAKKKSTGKPYSVFVFDRKSLDSHGNSLSRSSAAAFKRTADEVVDRLKREASALARLRHPSVLELVEPVEETRGGGLQFVTEPVTASLASLLQEKDDQERSGGPGGRSSRYVTEDSDGTRRRREIEIDELEIQKGLLQISKALEFLHENAGLVHGNLTPDAILINAKSDWKISGLSYCSPPEGSTKPTSFQPISLSEVLNPDPRLPRFVQINLDYTSPDFVMDNNLTTSADMFSLGILGVALYNSPHRSPIESNQSLSSYKRVFSSSSTTPSVNNNFCSARPLPKELSQHVLPRLITRRPAQRMTAKEFQMSEYFDNVLVSTIRFLDSFPAKTPNEKAQFMRGLNKVLPSFPKSVMEKKLLPALLEELKDRDLVSLILQNVFKIIDLLPSGRRAFGDKVRAKLKELFVTNVKNAQEKDPARDAGLMVVLENLATIATICGGKEFKDDILPIVGTALESPTPSVIDAALRSLPVILPVLDFSTIKNELFPVIATIFSRTNSLAIKVRGLQAFVILCGGSNDPNDDDGLDGLNERKAKSSSSSALDKYTMQEKIVPLIKVIKTKEPAVMIAALNVLRVVGKIADAEFVAMEILPILWNMSLGPLLDLKQFQTFMELIKSLSKRVEDEQIKKLQELAGTTNGSTAGPNDDFMSFGGVTGTQFDATSNAGDDDFESLVKGKPSGSSAANPMDAGGWDGMASGSGSNVTSPGVKPSVKSPTTAPTFSWSTPNNSTPSLPATVKAQASSFRTVTPDLGSFQTLAPSNTQYSQPLQPQSAFAPPPPASSTPMASTTASINWSSAATTPAAANPWASASSTSNTISSPPATSSFGGGLNSSMSSLSMNSRPTMSQQSSSFSLPPPPSNNSSFGMGGSGMGSGMSSFSLAPPPSASALQPSAGPKYGAGLSSGSTAQGMGMGMANNSTNSMTGSGMGMGMAAMMAQQQQKQQTQAPPQSNSGSGLDKFQSLL